MDARGLGKQCRCAGRWSGGAALLSLVAASAVGATVSTQNFQVTAPDARLAQQLAESAEYHRKALAIQWLGRELPPWPEKCPVQAQYHRGSGGVTEFFFGPQGPYGWRMSIQGSAERMLDSVLPHEVLHTVFATHFRRPLPRWADEGACSTIEHPDEILRLEKLLIQHLKSQKGIPFSQMVRMKQYPREIMRLYAQGHSACHFLVSRRGPQAFVDFLEDGMQDENWRRAAKSHYGYASLQEMQDAWMEWIKEGRPAISAESTDARVLASRNGTVRSAPIVRGQSPSRPPASRIADSRNSVIGISGPQDAVDTRQGSTFQSISAAHDSTKMMPGSNVRDNANSGFESGRTGNPLGVRSLPQPPQSLESNSLRQNTAAPKAPAARVVFEWQRSASR